MKASKTHIRIKSSRKKTSQSHRRVSSLATQANQPDLTPNSAQSSGDTYEDSLWAFPVKSAMEIKAVEDLCAISDKSVDISYEKKFENFWVDSGKAKKKQVLNIRSSREQNNINNFIVTVRESDRIDNESTKKSEMIHRNSFEDDRTANVVERSNMSKTKTEFHNINLQLDFQEYVEKILKKPQKVAQKTAYDQTESHKPIKEEKARSKSILVGKFIKDMTFSHKDSSLEEIRLLKEASYELLNSNEDRNIENSKTYSQKKLAKKLEIRSLNTSAAQSKRSSLQKDLKEGDSTQTLDRGAHRNDLLQLIGKLSEKKKIEYRSLGNIKMQVNKSKFKNSSIHESDLCGEILETNKEHSTREEAFEEQRPDSSRTKGRHLKTKLDLTNIHVQKENTKPNYAETQTSARSHRVEEIKGKAEVERDHKAESVKLIPLDEENREDKRIHEVVELWEKYRRCDLNDKIVSLKKRMQNTRDRQSISSSFKMDHSYRSKSTTDQSRDVIRGSSEERILNVRLTKYLLKETQNFEPLNKQSPRGYKKESIRVHRENKNTDIKHESDPIISKLLFNTNKRIQITGIKSNEKKEKVKIVKVPNTGVLSARDEKLLESHNNFNYIRSALQRNSLSSLKIDPSQEVKPMKSVKINIYQRKQPSSFIGRQIKKMEVLNQV